MASPLVTERFRQVNRLLEAAFLLEPSERGAWLDSLQGEDALFRPLVADLLAHAAVLDEGEFLRPLRALEAKELLSESTELQHLPGAVFGPYRLERELGRGGMATVWLAERIDGAVRRKVALKLPHQGLGGSLLAQRLARERDILASLEHPNIARLYDAGVDENGQPFLALEYVEGAPIDRYCRETALGLGQRLDLFIQVCRAVAHAHAHLVLHRDLKPSNILVTPDGQVRLLDFGVAKLLQEGADTAAETALTQIGGRALTPEYASPEQICRQPLSTASDVYSLGVVLYELLTGQRPYQLKRGSLGELEEAILTTDPPRPSRIAREGAQRSLSADLDTIVLKTLQKTPGARYPTVAALLDDIERFRTGMPVLARPDSAWYRFRKLVQRRKLLVVASAAVLAAVLLGAAGALWQARVARLQAARAEASAREARFEVRIARANLDFTGQIFGDAMSKGETAAMRTRLDRAREVLRRRYADEPVVHALLLLELAGRYDELGLTDREDEVMKEYDALAQKTGDASLLATHDCIDAFDEIGAGDLEKGRAHVARGLAMMAKVSPPRTESMFECLRADAMLSMRSGDSARAVRRMQELLDWLRASGLEKSRSYLSSLASLAYVYSLGGRYAKALEISQQKIALDELLGSDQTVGAYTERDNAAQLLAGLGRYAEACALDEKLLADFRGSDNQGVVPPAFFFHFAHDALEANELAQARSWFESTAETLSKTGVTAGAASAHVFLADIELRAGRLAESEAQLRRAGNLAPTTSLPVRSQIHIARLRLALAARRGDHEAVRTQLGVLDTSLRSIPDPARSQMVDRLAVLEARLEAGRALLGEGDRNAASGFAADSLALARSAVLPGKTSAWVGAAELLQAEIALSAGRGEEAHRLAREADRELADNLAPGHPLRVETAALVSETGAEAR